MNQHRHRFAPNPVDGYWPDDVGGGARTWTCDCGARQSFRPDLPAVDVAAAHLIADIRGDGLRSDTRRRS